MEVNNKMGLKGIKRKSVYRINEAQDRAKWRAYEKLQFTVIFYKCGIYSII
jgi:hypothetical protein